MLTEGVPLFKGPIGPFDLDDGPSVVIGQNHIKDRSLRSHAIAVNRDCGKAS